MPRPAKPVPTMTTWSLVTSCTLRCPQARPDAGEVRRRRGRSVSFCEGWKSGRRYSRMPREEDGRLLRRCARDAPVARGGARRSSVSLLARGA